MSERRKGACPKHGNAIVKVTEITTEWLRERGACHSQITKFIEVFGERALVDGDNFRLAVLNKFDMDWLARNLFKGSTLLAYQKMYRRAERYRDETISAAWNTMYEISKSQKGGVEGLCLWASAYRIYEDVRATENARFRGAWMDFYRRNGFY